MKEESLLLLSDLQKLINQVVLIDYIIIILGGFIMSEKTEITFMQTRLIRLASEEWHLPVEQIIHLFKEADVLGYIEKCYGIFHCEGDEAVLEDITEFLQRKGIEISA